LKKIDELALNNNHSLKMVQCSWFHCSWWWNPPCKTSALHYICL